MSGIDRAFRLFAKMPWARKRLIVEAIWWLAIARLIHLCLPFRHYAFILGTQGVSSPATVDDELTHRALAVGAAIAATAKFVPFKTLCLQQALAARLMLGLRRIQSTTLLGIDREVLKRTRRDSSGAAHAWVRVGRRNVVGGQDVSRYGVVTTFS